MEKVINLEDYYRTDKVCNVCKGPLELNRDQHCSKCKLRSRLGTLFDIAETAISDANRAVKQYL
ncbi:MAG: hypothetical protein KAS32_19575 [Candidatus Peribacteraceae bacterium]|nr:hypothetical protein [Candidatus Peribacteraceae bacterium]